MNLGKILEKSKTPRKIWTYPSISLLLLTKFKYPLLLETASLRTFSVKTYSSHSCPTAITGSVVIVTECFVVIVAELLVPMVTELFTVVIAKPSPIVVLGDTSLIL
uniref:Uncharacterized protein n=1 Tax=Cacopsylla melanoneura TaxID=428564 RepID=A0A8D9EG33_9HEMI